MNSSQIDSKPSAVLIESYNERMGKFLIPYPTQDVDITVGESDAEGVSEATIILNGKNSLTTKVKRLDLQDTLPLTTVPELEGAPFLRLLDDGDEATVAALLDVMNVVGLGDPDDIALLPLDEQVHLEVAGITSAILWSKHNLFVPPTELMVDDLSSESHYAQYIASNDNVKSVFELKAKPNSLAYTGVLNVIRLTKEAPTPPIVKFDLSTITNGDTPGVWTTDVDEVDFAAVTAQSATQAFLDVFNVSSDTKINFDQLTAVKDDVTITVTPSSTGEATLVGMLTITLNVIPKAVEYGPTGLAADYPGTGWYKATDTSTVFCKGVPDLETKQFEVEGVEYVSVHSKEDAKTFGASAATSNLTDTAELFKDDAVFNEDISGWDVSQVLTMEAMFQNASVFNQDLSDWCVSNIVSLPLDFDTGAEAWVLPKPVWGTCPGGAVEP